MRYNELVEGIKESLRLNEHENVIKEKIELLIETLKHDICQEQKQQQKSRRRK